MRGKASRAWLFAAVLACLVAGTDAIVSSGNVITPTYSTISPTTTVEPLVSPSDVVSSDSVNACFAATIAADVATIFEEMCVDMLITVDVHDSQIAGFYSPRCAFENCSILPTAARFLASSHELLSPVVVAPSAGLVERAMRYDEELAAANEVAHARVFDLPRRPLEEVVQSLRSNTT